MNEIKFIKDAENVMIVIPVSLLKFAAENNSQLSMTINNEQAFAEKVMFELEHNLGGYESGLTGFQELLDKATIAVVENGEDCIELKNDIP